MTLPGIAADDPTPRIARYFIFNAGDAGAPVSDMEVILYGNKTSDGSETADSTVSTTAVDDLADCLTKYGRRCEIQTLYREYTAVDKTATIRVIPVPEDGSATAASVTFTFANGAATVATEMVIEYAGETEYVSVAVGDTAITQAANLIAKCNAARNGTWPFVGAVGANPNEHIATFTCSNLGVRHGAHLTSLRVTYRKSTTTTCTKAAVTAGTVEDDFTTAYASAALGTYAIQVNPKTSTSAATATDNGIGEGVDYIKAQWLPAGGKEQFMFFGLVGTQAQQTTVCQSAGANFVAAKFIWSENNPKTAGMMAAQFAAINRLNYMFHPAENLAGYNADRGNFTFVAPRSRADWPTASEIRACLNTGATPLAVDALGKPYIVRDITSKCLDGTSPDYRARSGHIPFVVRFAWLVADADYRSNVKQRGIAENPLPGHKPKPKTTTPGAVEKMLMRVIDKLTDGNPLGQYTGPILDPSPAAIAAMKASIVVTKFAGGFSATCEWKALEHNYFNEFTARETSPNI